VGTANSRSTAVTVRHEERPRSIGQPARHAADELSEWGAAAATPGTARGRAANWAPAHGDGLARRLQPPSGGSPQQHDVWVGVRRVSTQRSSDGQAARGSRAKTHAHRASVRDAFGGVGSYSRSETLHRAATNIRGLWLISRFTHASASLSVLTLEGQRWSRCRRVCRCRIQEVVRRVSCGYSRPSATEAE